MADARHELLVKVAVGGTSTVFVGRERGGGELVAIKRMHPYLASDESARAQMLREASIAGRVRHDHLVHIHGVEESGEELLLVMDYVEGGSLAELLAQRPLPLGAGLRIVLDAASGLSALHEVTDPETGRRLGFVHRDISPQNILVGRDGRARLGDFGLVKRTDVSTTHTTVVRGKVAYMAPEQIEGQRARQAADLYALGVVLWEVVSGERLFRGVNDADTMRRVLVGAVPALADRGHPAALDDVVRRCLARDPAARYAHVGDLIAAIEGAAASIDLASREEIAALVDDALGEALEQRRETIAASVDAETTATGDVDIDAILASGRASAGLVTAPVPTLPQGERGGFVESDTLPFSDRPPAPSGAEESVAADDGSPERVTAAKPPGASSSTRTTMIAILAALAGASVSWLVARSPADADGTAAPSTAATDAREVRTSVPAPVDRDETAAPTPSAETMDEAGLDEAGPDVPGTGAAPTGAPAKAPPVARPTPPAPKKHVPPTNKRGDADVLVPDNPYR